MLMAMAAFALPACRIAARCFACRTASGPGRPPARANLSAAALEPVFAHADQLDFFLIGAGRDPFLLPAELRAQFRALALSVDCLATGPAVRTYNILLAEGRRVGAGLIAVE